MNFRFSPLTPAVLLAICLNVTLRAQDTAGRQQVNNITKERRIDNWLRRQDRNADGKIAGDEATGLMKSNSARNDANKDNFLDRNELGELAERLARGFGRNRRGRNQQTVTTEQLLRQTYMRYEDGSGHGTFAANIKETGPAREKFFERTLKKKGSKYVFTVRDGKTYLNGKEFIVKGLRCSNALVSDRSAAELTSNLDTFASFGVNTVSVFFMGSRFGDVKGYSRDGSLNPVYAARMGRIIEAADELCMVVLVGCLYWGNSKAKWEQWTQAEADAAIANTVRWLKEHGYRNVFVDVDNEGMAKRAKGFDNRLMVVAGKKVDPNCVIATNFKGPPPPEADLGLHFSAKVPGKPYIESEGTPTNAPGGYWGKYSKKPDYYNYINIGIYNEAMKARQKAITAEHLDNGHGYMCASTWLQCPPPSGPNSCPGGDGSKQSPGIRWWLEFIRDNYGPYTPPRPGQEQSLD